MFKSTKDFDYAIYNLLSDINESIPFAEIAQKFDNQIEFSDVLEHCCNYNLINGVAIGNRSLKGNLHFSATESVRLTRAGLELIENFKNNA